MCEKMSAHWKEKEHWLSDENRENWGYPLKKEIWDGKQFARLQYFWNPNCEWILPVMCPVDGCGRIISSEMILNSPLIGGNQDKRQITCPRCYNEFEHEVKKTRGDPRNLAYDVHWDGWQPFSSGKRGSGAIELQVVNMSKEDRCSVEEVYVIGFVPTYLLPNKCPIFLDPFLEPLIIDIETGFIKGIDVNCSVPMCGKPEGPAIIRHLILCFSGDHNGICEAGKFVKMGKCACRRCCLLESIYIPERCHYYYTNFRKQGRFPAEKKSILDSLDIIDEIDAEERVSVRKEMARDSGYTGLSILHRLHPLYGFLYDEHMLFDEMHTFSLNIVKSALLDLLDDEDSSIDWNVVEERLNNMPWTTEFKSSRYPKNFIKSVRSWKAEEFLIFAYPTSEVVFDGLLSDQQREEWMCIARMIEFIKNHARNGWTKENCDTFHAMCLRYAVLLEERRGAHKCVIILHNLLHLKEDILNFGGLDNYSCWTKERAVRRYISQSSNCKNIEATFANTEVRRECLKIKEENKTTAVLNYERVDSAKVWGKTINDAKELHKANPTIDHRGNGILVGASKNYLLSDTNRKLVAASCRVQEDLVDELITVYRSIWKPKHQYNGLLYRTNENIVTTSYGESVVVLKEIFVAEVDGELKHLCKCESYEHVGFSDLGAKLVQKRNNEIMVSPLSTISRKIMLAKYGDVNGIPTFIVVDFMRRIFPIGADSVVVPYYPVANDMVLVMGNQPDTLWRARVVSYNIPRKVVKGQFFIEQADRLWIPEATRHQEINFDSIMGLSNGTWQRQFSQWVELQ